MNMKYNSAKRLLAGVTIALALLVAVSRPPQVAASNGIGAENAGILSAVQSAALQTYEGSAQFAQELRSLYTVYRLQTTEFSPVEEVSLSATSGDEAQLIRCEIFPAPANPKKKSVI